MLLERPLQSSVLCLRFLGGIAGLLALALLAMPHNLPAQTVYESPIHSFTNSLTDGDYPAYGTLLADAAGNLYGTIEGGGLSGYGTVFEIVNNSGVYREKILYSFRYVGGDGADPYGGLIMDGQGNLYGTTRSGSASAYGTVFELVNNSGTYTESILHSFSNTDGANPIGKLTMDAQGNLYGTTSGGGTSGWGTVFELVNNSGVYTENVLYSFTTSGTDGDSPYAGLIMDSQGNLYGTTSVTVGNNGYGLAYVGSGTVFELVNNSGTYTEKTLHAFPQLSSINTDGGNLQSGLIMDAQGNLYGTTVQGTSCGCGSGYGTVFELVNNSGSYAEKILYSFTNQGGDGADPYGDLLMDGQGNLYGTTGSGGTTTSDTTSGQGTAFELVNNSGSYTESILHSFNGLNGDGAYPQSGLAIAPNGLLYGTTEGGGTVGGGPSAAGTVYQIAIVPNGTTYDTTTSLTYSPNPVTTGNVTLSALVSTTQGLVPSGTLSFYSGSQLLGTSPVDEGSVTLTLDTDVIGVGTFTITADYTPSVSIFNPSSGQATMTLAESGVAVTSGNNTFNGNQTVNGNVNATAFIGNGSGLTNVLASGLNCTGCIGNQQLAVNYAASAYQGGPASSAINSLALGGFPASAFASTAANTFTGDQTVNGNLSLSGALNAASASFSNPVSFAGLALGASGTATASQGFNSGTLDSTASVFSSTSGTAQNLLFRWQAEPVASTNNTANPKATLNLLFGGNSAPTETGLSVNPDGTINFAAGQTFPSVGGISGVTAGAGLSGGGTSGTVSLSIPNGGVTNAMLVNPTVTLSAGTGLSGGGSVPLGGSATLSLAANSCAAGSAITALPFTCSPFASTSANVFTGNQNVNGTVTATGFVGSGAGLTGVSAVTAGTAATAANSLALGGNAPSYYATIGANTFTGNQSMPNLDVSSAAAAGSITIGGGTQISEVVSITHSLTLQPLNSATCTTFTTQPINGYSPGTSDTLSLGLPASLVSGLSGNVYLMYQAWETNTNAAPTITIQVCNPTGSRYKGGNSGTIRIDVIKH